MARFAAGDEQSLAVVFERHRPALRRQAARMLYATGHDPDDVLQDVFLRVHVALRTGVVPLQPRAWLGKLVHNTCVDELRRARWRPVGDAVLDGVPGPAAPLPDELARRAEARSLLGDIHRLPERQRSVLVMSAIDGLSHEEVATRLSTTVETTRSLLARARENLRRTAAARETDCGAVRLALDEAVSSGVRASEVARRHLWSCSGCRIYQRDLRGTPSRLRRLAGWGPWGAFAQLLGGGGLAGVQKVAVGACCALAVGGGAVAVPEVALHARRGPAVAALVPADTAREAHERPAHRRHEVETPIVAATATPIATRLASSTPASGGRTAVAAASRTAPRSRIAFPSLVGRSAARAKQLRRLRARALAYRYPSLPPGTAVPTATPTPVATAAPQAPAPAPAAPAPTAAAVAVAPPVETPIATPVATPIATPVETATPAPTATATPTPVLE
ncbi:MAG TPA: sigma-70 family RNA polymerase sigma factor [Solirubrobacter sp.]|nr:sigma-70 family RNA polymerase sigma factor [Solirubrobacter sp.]